MSNSDISLYQEFIHTTRYARWLHEEQRRESWEETVTRYVDYIFKKVAVVDPALKQEIYDNIYSMQIMPSMRALMTAGPALDISNVAGFNCSYLTLDDVRAFDELLYILMCGTGVGFSVERKYVTKLPKVPAVLHRGLEPIVVEDSKMGWAQAIQDLIHDLYYKGTIRRLDTHLVRLAGEPLKTFGGRASGPAPLEEVAEFITRTFVKAQGRQLSSLECHDICCKIAACVVVGGVRRSALISLSDLDDEEMRECKSGEWYIDNKQRALANNSAVYYDRPSRSEMAAEWDGLVASGSGERGIFNRSAANRQAARIGRSTAYDFGTNPCAEILLRPFEFCNLTEVMARPNDTVETLHRKVQLATILGTFQSTLTNFDYLRPIWKQHCDEERLLGVSLTGIFDCPLLFDDELQSSLRDASRASNKEWAGKLGINASAMITCVKPSGTVSQLTDTASGIHPRYAPYYIRRVRNDAKDPVTKFLVDQGFTAEVDFYNKDARVFSFPMKAPEGAVVQRDLTAISHLETWKQFRQHWCDHNPSVTISVRKGEWTQVYEWVYENFDEICGVSFLPLEDHTYEQAPYEQIDEATYDQMKAGLPGSINWADLRFYENGGAEIVAGRELACQGGACEL